MKTEYILAVLLAISFISCDGSDFDTKNLFPEEYHKVISIRENDEKMLIIGNNDFTPLVEKVLVNKTGSVAYYEADAKLVIQSQSQLEESLGTDVVQNNYKVLPPEAYMIIGDLDIHFSARVDAKAFEFVFYPEKIRELPLEDINGNRIVYVMQIELESKSDALVNQDKKNMLWVFNRNLVQ